MLRVKRRRNENPPSTIRLELLDGWNVRRHDENDAVTATATTASQDTRMATSREASSMDEILDSEENTTTTTNSNTDGHPYPLRSSSTITLRDASRHSAMSTSSATSSNTTTVAAVPRRTTTAAAIWKRVEVLEGGDALFPGSSASSGLNGEKRCRVVEAVLEQDERSTKRRKLTVLGEATPGDTKSKQQQQRKKSGYLVLDPVTRIVDDSLNMVHTGERSTTEHYSMITTDPRLATHARTWMVYNHRAGNLLHACAHWNDVELAHDLLRQNLPKDLLSEAMDGDGRTPYEVAELCGHTSIVELLEAFGADTSNYVYDMFVPEDIEMETAAAPPSAMATSTSSAMSQSTVDPGADAEDDTFNPLVKTPLNIGSSNGVGVSPAAAAASPGGVPATAASGPPHPPDFANIDTSRLLALQGGVGYWTEDGELILEVEAHHMLGMADEYDHDTDDEIDEDDIDSNCEDYGGNDYPDEDYIDSHWEEQFLPEEPVINHDDDSEYGGSGDGAYGEEVVW